MYSLYAKINEKETLFIYENKEMPHLWLLATHGQSSFEKQQFCENLMEIASQVNDDLFIGEVAEMITVIDAIECDTLYIDGNIQTADLQQLIALVDLYNFEPVFGTLVNRLEYKTTADSSEYFKTYRSQYRSQYRSLSTMLIAINVIVYVVNMTLDYYDIQFINGTLSLADPLTYATILFAGFTHFSVIHIGMNMVFLYQLGPVIERAIGLGKYTLLYFGSLFISGITVVLLTSGQVMTAGASGALYGLFAYLVLFMLKYSTSVANKKNILSTFGLNILITFLIPGISIAGHLGGAVAGAIFFYVSEFRK